MVDLLQPDVARELTARPERLTDIVRGAPGRQTIVLDEVQRVPELLNVVHALIESKDRRRFVLTGSSARKLRRGGEVLEDLLLAFRVPVFTRRAKRETSAHPKLFLFDAGVFRSLRPRGPLDRPEENSDRVRPDDLRGLEAFGTPIEA